MNVELYEYKSNQQYLSYEFFSEGPKGKIKKIVEFALVESNDIPFYNLGFGDWNEQKDTIDDFITTNNSDAQKVLATLAAIVVDFTTQFPDALIFVIGTTPSRTRKYQMGINSVWLEIKNDYYIYGVNEDETLEPFKQKVNYKAFFARRK